LNAFKLRGVVSGYHQETVLLFVVAGDYETLLYIEPSESDSRHKDDYHV